MSSVQSYPPFGSVALVIPAQSSHILTLNFKNKKRWQVLLMFSFFFNLLGEASDVLFNLKRNGQSIVGGPQLLIKEGLEVTGEFAVPWYTVDNTSSKRGACSTVYTLELINQAADVIRIDNYTFLAFPLNTLSFTQVYAVGSDTSNDLVLAPGATSSMTVSSSPSCGVATGVLTVAAEVTLSETQPFLMFSISKTTPNASPVSLTNGVQPWTKLPGTYAVNWVAVDKQDDTRCKKKTVPVTHVVDFVNAGQSPIRVSSRALTLSTVPSETVASLSLYTPSLLPTGATEFRIKLSTTASRHTKFVTLTLNLQLQKTSANVLLYHDVLREDGSSVTNGVQPWVLSESTTPRTDVFVTNSVLVDTDCCSHKHRHYTLRLVNQDLTPVTLNALSFTGMVIYE